MTLPDLENLIATGKLKREPPNQNELDGLAETLDGLVLAAPLTIGTRDFRAIGDVPTVILLNNRSELVSHVVHHTTRAATRSQERPRRP